MTDRWRARGFLLGLTVAVTLPAPAWAQAPSVPPPPPPIEAAPPAGPAPAPPEVGVPPQEAPPPVPPPPQEAPPPLPPPPAVPPPQPLEGPVPATVPTTWGPTEPEEVVVETARGPIARPRLSGAVGFGTSFDSVGFGDGTQAVPAFLGLLGIGDGLLGLDLGAFATSATRKQRASDNPVDRVAVDLFGVVRPAALHRRDDRSFNMRVLHSLAGEMGLGLERAGRSNISGTRFLFHLGATVDVPLSPASEATELRLRLGVQRNFGLYTPKLYGVPVTDVRDTAAEVYAALAVVF